MVKGDCYPKLTPKVILITCTISSGLSKELEKFAKLWKNEANGLFLWKSDLGLADGTNLDRTKVHRTKFAPEMLRR